MQPWAKEALQLSHNIGGALRGLQQTLRSINLTSEGQNTQKLIEEAHNIATQSIEVIHPLKTYIQALKRKMQELGPKWLGMSH